ncbi:UvrD-helicase domain-containing protein [Actinophytocola sp.]|uniref:UvrD-helicase domain-containing protein n=1 Tax=Actinophytocola sp. TaxID=1872138 RepID=UPI002D511910|nr:UvrD-helicase domain-containing protein [Actinophytocola sp.]HYQ67791.1 UvrD-helicase domain-containing protein [Actinophytocola sp.]
MRFHADLHIHSKYSRACSRDCDLEHLTWWARRKGVTLVGTGDFTHPAWFEHLRENLVPAEPGVFRLREDLDAEIARRLPPNLAGRAVRFMLSVEISTIYKRGEKTRKVHHLVYLPDFDSVATFNAKLGRIGNLGSDGRPILGLDSRDLLEITLESSEHGYLVPAHLWTPWFAVLGSKSGFDAVEDCYADLADHIFAVETGLSSDPAMNWRVSSLDRYRLVSNSDAHSPPILGRESTVFDTELDYFAVRSALETGDGLAGTVEFFPEEGKYHVDGHRKCGVRLDPEETRALGGVCPACGKPVTVGVLSRVEELADRPDGHRPDGAPEFHNLVPLPEIMSEIVGTGPKSKKVLAEIDKLTATFGPELSILAEVPPAEFERGWPLLAEAVTRLRRGEVIRDAGYDGEYGEIRLFEPGELVSRRLVAAPDLFAGLFDEPPVPDELVAEPGLFDDVPELAARPAPPEPEPEPVVAPEPEPEPAPAEPFDGPGLFDDLPESVFHSPAAAGSVLDGLDPDQRAAAGSGPGPLLIIAGPGTGKTRTLTHRIAHLVREREVPPEQCLAITFTRRAAEEMAERLAVLVPEQAPALTVATFHSLGVRILREQHANVGLSADFGIADQTTQLVIAEEIAGAEARGLLAARRGGESDHAVEQYLKALRQRDLVDFDDLVNLPLALFEADPALAARYRERYRWIWVDEYQDVDDRQYRLLRQLAPPAGNLTAIGDPDQAIYRFRGADVGFFLRFAEDFPTARTVTLTRNYRSSAHILAAAVSMIAPTTLVRDRELLPMTDHGDALVGVHHAASERAEAEFVAHTIDRLLGGGAFHSFDSGRVESHSDARGLGFADFAVLYRTDRQARVVMEALGQAGWPCQKRSHDRLADRPGVERLVAELPYVRGPIRDRLHTAARNLADDELYPAVELLTPLAERCGDDLERFLTELSLGVEVDTWDPRADRISLLTLHASKGLEFPVVFVVGCADGLLPLRWPGTKPTEEELTEERRLLFVGMTRAQRHLYLSHAGDPSPFLATVDSTERVGDRQKRRPRDAQLRLL